MAAPPEGQELGDLGSAELVHEVEIDGDVRGSDDEGPADEPEGASRDHFNQRWSAGKASLFRTAQRFINRMTKDTKESRGHMPHGKVALPEMLLIITSPAGNVEVMKSAMYDNGEFQLMFLVRLSGVHAPSVTLQLDSCHPMQRPPQDSSSSSTSTRSICTRPSLYPTQRMGSESPMRSMPTTTQIPRRGCQSN